MAATIATTALLNAKSLTTTKASITNQAKPKLISLMSMKNLPKGLLSANKIIDNSSSLAAGTALAGAVFSALAATEPALAAQQIAEIAADGDNRGLALLLPIIPAIGWVLFNILQPALNQLNRMRSSKGVIIGLGLGGLTAAHFAHPDTASAAAEVAALADAASGDNRGQLLLFVVAPALLWVGYNILQPALNQLNRMRSE